MTLYDFSRHENLHVHYFDFVPAVSGEELINKRKQIVIFYKYHTIIQNI